ncbi:hypothetical protein [Chachezhania sediminis]|nr:hypothetical protein [Chachezhania sediminis]
MTDRHLRSPDLPDFDAPVIRHGMTARTADIRRRHMTPTDRGHRVEAS